MQAAVYYKYGTPDVIQIKDVATPSPTTNEVLVRVSATTVNRTDCANLSAKPFIMRFVNGLLRPRKPIPGTEFAGVIEAVGSEVTSFRVGDKVFGFDDGILGSQAQYLTIDQNAALATLPNAASFEQAAASVEGSHYAYNMINKVNLQPGQSALVNGASGGIGSAAVQLLKHYAIEVTAVCGARNIELVRSLGADRVIDYGKTDFTRTGHEYDCVFDTVGKSTFGKCRRILKPGGVYISSELGAMGQNVILALVTPLFAGKQVRFPLPLDKRRSVLLVKKLIEEGRFMPVIDRTYPLAEIAEAYRYVASGHKSGNVVISPV